MEKNIFTFERVPIHIKEKKTTGWTGKTLTLEYLSIVGYRIILNQSSAN